MLAVFINITDVAKKQIIQHQNIEFFNHILDCESEDHVDSPIGITWYTKEQLYKKNLKEVDEKVVYASFKKRPETR